MYTNPSMPKSAGIILLIVGFTMVMSGAINVYGFPVLGPNIPARISFLRRVRPYQDPARQFRFSGDMGKSVLPGLDVVVRQHCL